MRAFDPALYPFAPHFFDRGAGIRMHALDEGRGPPVVMVHGNPTWSFYYRNLVLGLRETHRCLAPDHVGMGLSDKPDDAAYSYTLAQRIADFERWLDHLALGEPLTLVVHDWGGMIALAWAARHPERIARLVILNTAAFPLPAGKSLPWQLGLTRTPLGTVLVRGFNAFSRGAARIGCKAHPMPAAVRAGYEAPYDSWANRIATLRFVQDIPLQRGSAGFEIVESTAARLPSLRDKPALIVWGARDPVFDLDFLAEWKRHLPAARVELRPEAGHYVLEDAQAAVIPLIVDFIRGAHP